jgi:hypothetical protein
MEANVSKNLALYGQSVSSSHIFCICLAIAHKQMMLLNISGHFWTWSWKNWVIMSNLITSASIVRRTRPKVVMWFRLMKVLSNFIYLDPMVKKPITCGKGAGINVQAKSLTTNFADMTFCNYPQLLLIFPERRTQVETMGKKSTWASHQELHFKEVITLKPHADNTDQQDTAAEMIQFWARNQLETRQKPLLFSDGCYGENSYFLQNCAQFKIFTTILDHSLQATPLYGAQNHKKYKIAP